MALSLSPKAIIEKKEYPLLVKAPWWRRVLLRDIADVQNGFAFKSSFFSRDKGVPLIRIRDIAKDKTEHLYNGHYDNEFLVSHGDILIGMDGDFTVARWRGKQGLLNQRVCRIISTSKLYNERFLFIVLQPYLDAINAETSSVTVKHLSSKTVGEIPLPLPPLPEQHRIVAKIEQLFSELDKGVAELKKAREKLELYRQSLLKAAFEGRLTEEWRKEHADQLESAEELLARIKAERDKRYQQQLEEWRQAVKKWEADGKPGKKPRKPRKPKELPPLTDEQLAELPELPEGWGWIYLNDIAEIVGGVTKGRKLDGKKTIKLPYLRVANVQDGFLNLAIIKKIDVLYEDLEKYRLLPGDILYTEGGDKDKLGRGAIWEGQIENCIHQNHIFRARVFKPLFYPKYVSYFSQTQTAKSYFFKHAKQTTNLASINLTVLSGLPLPLISEKEQLEVVSTLEGFFTTLDHLTQTIDQSLSRAELLRQSILKKAFSGRLVSQDPNDEPASELLKRIQAEKEKAAQAHVRATGRSPRSSRSPRHSSPRSHK